jgi:hypothetical protein
MAKSVVFQCLPPHLVAAYLAVLQIFHIKFGSGYYPESRYYLLITGKYYLIVRPAFFSPVPYQLKNIRSSKREKKAREFESHAVVPGSLSKISQKSLGCFPSCWILFVNQGILSGRMDCSSVDPQIQCTGVASFSLPSPPLGGEANGAWIVLRKINPPGSYLVGNLFENEEPLGWNITSGWNELVSFAHLPHGMR